MAITAALLMLAIHGRITRLLDDAKAKGGGGLDWWSGELRKGSLLHPH